MFPKIPEKLSELGSVELRALAAEIKAKAKEILDADPTPEQVAECKTYAAHRKAILAEADRQDAKSEVSGEFDDEDEDAELAAKGKTKTADDGGEGDDGGLPESQTRRASGQPGAPEHTERGEPQPVQRARTVPTEGGEELADDDDDKGAGSLAVRTRTGVASKPDTKPAKQRIVPSQLLSRDGVSGKQAGDNFDSWRELAEALLDKAGNLRTNTSEKFQVGFIPGRFDERHVLTDDPLFNLQLFDLEDEEIMAAMCAPLEPQYDLACWNTTRRPVRNSMAGFRAPRGGVTIYPSPSLEDITTGVGVWTAADDANPNAEKLACQTIECATPVEYRIYGVYRCLTVKNLLAMTFPELVEAYLNRLAAAHARLAETQLLEAMATGAQTLSAPVLGYNATTSITTTILNYLALYQEVQRWDVGAMDVWMPRWVLFAIKADLMRRRNTSGNYLNAPSDAQVAALFSDVGVTPHFWLDTPSWATPIPALQVAGVLGQFPRNLEMLVAPRGKFAVMDRGELAIGVTGNNIYRDNASNARNEFTFFFENFEGVVNTNSCPAHILQIDDLCYNGQQIADVVMNCEGGDQEGEAS